MSKARVQSTAATILLAVATIFVGVYFQPVFWVLVGLLVVTAAILLATFPRFPLAWRGFSAVQKCWGQVLHPVKLNVCKT
jgi:hypothetical protein